MLLLLNSALVCAVMAAPADNDLEVPSRAPEAAADGLAADPTPPAGSERGGALPLSSPDAALPDGLVDPGDRALGPFYDRLLALRRGSTATVRIAHWGDSHTAADVFSGRLRRKLQADFGDAGPGFVLLGKPWRSYFHFKVKTGVDARWRPERIYGRYSRRRPEPRDDLLGLAGVSVYTRAERTAWVELRGGGELRELDLYYLAQPGGGTLELRAGAGRGGKMTRLRRLRTRSKEKSPGFLRLKLPAGTRRLAFRAAGGEVRLYGVDLHRGRAGVLYHTFGINGARATSVLQWNEALMGVHLGRLQPHLVVLAYGTNAVDNRSLGREDFADGFEQLLQRMGRLAPQAACLVVGPPDRKRRQRGGRVVPENLDFIVAEERRLALAHGCAFWDQRAAMGGAGSIDQWVAQSPPLARKDRVHFYVPGYYRLADALYRELMDGVLRRAAGRKLDSL